MAEYSTDVNPTRDDGNESVVLERVRELTWALLDEQITEDEMALLDSLLLSDDTARSIYIECVYLHSDLAARFGTQPAPANTTIAAKSPVLGFLSAGMLPLDLQSPPAEELNS